MSQLIDTVRATIVTIWAIIMTALAPTANAILLLVIFALFNAFIGYQCNSITRHERFSFRKFWRAGGELLLYLSLVVLLHITFYVFGETEKSLFAIKAIAWIAVWGYLVKILQNALKVFPHAQGLKLLYHIVGIKFIGKYLRGYGLQITDEELRETYKYGRDEEKDPEGDPKQ